MYKIFCRFQNLSQRTLQECFASQSQKAPTEDPDGPSERCTDSAVVNDCRGTEPAVPKPKIANSAVWKYFHKRANLGQSVCKYCEKVVQSTNATNAKRHLKICQPDKHATVVLDDNKSRSKYTVKLTSLSFSKYYEVNHPKQLKFRKALAAIVSGTTITASSLCTEEVREAFHAADPKLRVPHRSTINKDSKALVS
ncbi:unnamed protein product, partial [Allacma fusca]